MLSWFGIFIDEHERPEKILRVASVVASFWLTINGNSIDEKETGISVKRTKTLVVFHNKLIEKNDFSSSDQDTKNKHRPFLKCLLSNDVEINLFLMRHIMKQRRQCISSISIILRRNSIRQKKIFSFFSVENNRSKHFFIGKIDNYDAKHSLKQRD